MRTVCRLLPLRNVFLACSTKSATSAGSGVTDSVPEWMRPASSRSLMRPRMWSACSSMIRKNCSISAGSGAGRAPSTVAVEPLMEVSGARSSWLTIPRNSARSRLNSSSGAKSCMVTTTDSTVPSSERTGVALINVLTLRPSGTESTISSASTFLALLNSRASGNSSSAISRPLANRHVSTSAKSSECGPACTGSRQSAAPLD